MGRRRMLQLSGCCRGCRPGKSDPVSESEEAEKDEVLVGEGEEQRRLMSRLLGS